MTRRLVSVRLLVTTLLLLATACAPKSRLMHQLEGDGVLPTPPPDKALVVFMRPSRVGYRISAAVYEDDAFRGVVMHDARLAFETSPGRHRYMVVSEAADFLDADLAGGLMYLIEVAPRMGAWRARFSLAPITPQGRRWSALDGWLEHSYGVAPNADGEAWAQGNAASVAKKRDAYLPKWLAKDDQPALTATDGVTRP